MPLRPIQTVLGGFQKTLQIVTSLFSRKYSMKGLIANATASWTNGSQASNAILTAKNGHTSVVAANHVAAELLLKKKLADQRRRLYGK